MFIWSFCKVHIQLNQGFTVSLSGEPFTRISCDQVIEITMNGAPKDAGGLSEKYKILVPVSVGCELTF